MISGRVINRLTQLQLKRHSLTVSSCTCRIRTRTLTFFTTTTRPRVPDRRDHNIQQIQQNLFSRFILNQPTGSHDSRLLSTTSSTGETNKTEEALLHCESFEEWETDGWEEEAAMEWEEEEEAEAKIGDGGDGGGVVLQGVPWGEQALAIAREVLVGYGNGVELYAFKTTPRGYVYVRLDELSNKFGSPSIEKLESYCQEYKKRLEEAGASGKIPDDLAVEVSSPGAERLLRVPDDLSRFKDMPMNICYVEHSGAEKNGVFYLESIETESQKCVWKLADVKENRDPQSKGRPMSRKMKDWRLELPYEMHRKVILYLEF